MVNQVTATFLSSLYGEESDGYLNIWALEGRRSHWFSVKELNAAAAEAIRLSESSNVYFGVGLHPEPLGERARGDAAGVRAIPGAWVEIDIFGPAHSAPNLPRSMAEALALLDAFPLRPGIILDSGHGVQVWWPFKEPWVFDDDAERQSAHDLVRRLQRWFQAAARERGWRVDTTSDLARVLRLPGTWNRKLEPVPVRVVQVDDTRRYVPDDFEFLPLVEGQTLVRQERSLPECAEAEIELIVEGCAFMRHCRDDAATLPEPAWYAGLSILGRCRGGDALAHEWSRPYPGYSAEETTHKLCQAGERSGPRTCANVRNELGFEGCASCPHWGRISSPIQLGDRPRTVTHQGRQVWPPVEGVAIDGEAEDRKPGARPLWKRCLEALPSDSDLIFADSGDAYVRLPTGELMSVRSDDCALYFQARCDRDAYFGSDKFNRAAGALRSYIREEGRRATVRIQSWVDFERQIAWIGIEGGQKLYRVTPERIEIVPNGDDDVLVTNGCAPLLDEVAATGQLARWLEEQTWLRPFGRLILAILAPMMALGAQSFAQSRPLIVATGSKGTGKTTSMQMLGNLLAGRNAVAQRIKPDERENEARIVNELFAVVDNLEGTPPHVDVEGFLATACTSADVAIRKMRAEGELVRKPITAWVAVTSFSVPACVRRTDVMDRALICEFCRPENGRVRELRNRVPDRRAVWGDILTLLQQVLSRWPETPEGSDIRCVEFMRFAHGLLSRDTAQRVELGLMALQATTAATDDVVLQALESYPLPRYPMTAGQLLEYWWPAKMADGSFVLKDPNRPNSAVALGALLRNRAGRFGGWLVTGERCPIKNTTLWTFARNDSLSGLTQEEAEMALRTLLPGNEDYREDVCFPVTRSDDAASGECRFCGWDRATELLEKRRGEWLCRDVKACSRRGRRSEAGGEGAAV